MAGYLEWLEATQPAVLLASSSNRTRELLSHLGVGFDVIVPKGKEDREPAKNETPERFAMRLAWQKTAEVARTHPDALVLAAESIVVLDGRVLARPGDSAQAAEMLRALRGREHRVITGLFLLRVNAGLQAGAAEETIVAFRDYSDADVDAYVASGDPLDASGAVLSPSFRPVERVEGCYFNALGLSLCAARNLLFNARMEDVVLRPGFVVPDACRGASCRFALGAPVARP